MPPALEGQKTKTHSFVLNEVPRTCYPLTFATGGGADTGGMGYPSVYINIYAYIVAYIDTHAYTYSSWSQRGTRLCDPFVPVSYPLLSRHLAIYCQAFILLSRAKRHSSSIAKVLRRIFWLLCHLCLLQVTTHVHIFQQTSFVDRVATSYNQET